MSFAAITAYLLIFHCTPRPVSSVVALRDLCAPSHSMVRIFDEDTEEVLLEFWGTPQLEPHTPANEDMVCVSYTYYYLSFTMEA